MKKNTQTRTFAAPYGWIIRPMTEQDNYEIAQWVYDGVYAFYNCTVIPPSPQNPDKFIGNSFAVENAAGELIGHFCFGEDAQIPTVEEAVYSPGYLDFGLGMRPDLCGQGLGASFVQTGLSFGTETYHTGRFRLSVAQFNERAIRVYEKASFIKVREVTYSHLKNRFFIMIKEENNV